MQLKSYFLANNITLRQWENGVYIFHQHYRQPEWKKWKRIEGGGKLLTINVCVVNIIYMIIYYIRNTNSSLDQSFAYKNLL